MFDKTPDATSGLLQDSPPSSPGKVKPRTGGDSPSVTNLHFIDARAEVARVAKVLKRWIMYEKGLSLRWVDEQTGHAHGYTSQVLGPGSPKLHLEGLYEILEVIGMSPAEFWQDVYSEAPAPETREPKESERLVDPEQLDELVTLFREVARRAVQEMVTDDQSPPAERRPGRGGKRG